MFARSAGRTRRAAVRLASAIDLHPPSAVLGRRAGRRAHAEGHAPLAVLGDNITTDHLSPSNAIMLDSAAGEYLQNGPAGRGLQFLRHPPRRPPDRAARHLRQSNAEERNGARCDGKVKAGSLARIEPEGKVTRMWEAIETYMDASSR
jgi:aconitate hydratase